VNSLTNPRRARSPSFLPTGSQMSTPGSVRTKATEVRKKSSQPDDVIGIFDRNGARIWLRAIEEGTGLAIRGYEVIAIDNYQPLLADLISRAGSLPIRTVVADLLDFKIHVTQPVDVIVCMGDTLTHLTEVASVEALFDAAAVALVRGGVFVLTFRDYVSAELRGDARFISVRSDDNRILTCFLEYSNATVQVHDVLHERVAGQWHLRLSSYPKLRLSPEWVVSALISRGFTVRCEPGLSGMVRVVARR